MKCWAPVEKPDIVFYLLHSKACDLQDVRAYKSLDSYQYLTAGLVGMVHHHRMNGDLAYYKAEVVRSQSFNAAPHKAWVCLHKSCSCKAGKARVCSHMGAILWKMEYAFSNNMTGIACTDEAAAWNRGTKRNELWERRECRRTTRRFARRSLGEYYRCYRFLPCC
ncbi:hypothetical protein HPB47_006619 [Ixodes persulcatus]|uniref:Uncharacterized protein n=1 Tax=Ixodes persulcatus TaxID=34615 RepID=A0AC60P9Q9_IXOPE|nr:hypothetical protein HPB47_006619 [Ixodes persulcatus]